MNLRRLIATLLLTAALTAQAQTRHQMLVDEKTNSVVEITGVFSFVPPSGCAPVRVKAINNTTGDIAVTVRTTSEANNSYGNDHQLESSFTLTAAAGKTTERELMVPLCASVGGGGYSSPQLRLEVQAGGRTERFSDSVGGYGGLPFVAFSTALAGKSIGDINGATTGTSGKSYSYGRENFAALFNAADLSADWRGCSGLDVLAITSDEWTTLQPAVKSAVLQWVKLGGTLHLHSKAGAPDLAALGIVTQGATGHRYGGDVFLLGNGRVCDPVWNGSELEAAGVASIFSNRSRVSPHCEVRRHEYALSLKERNPGNAANPSGDPTPLIGALGEKSFAAWQVGLILFVFGIVVGPVNLFYFAGKGRRHRLFFTTPVISLAAAALLLLVIFFQDGTGGKGHRASLVYLDSTENAAFIHQMQVARTGVLFGGTFEVADPAVVNMAVLPDSRWTRLKGGDDTRSSYRSYSSRSEAQRYSVQEKSHSGDYFQSRTEQGQFVDSVQSTRSRIELKPGSNPPVITSTIGATLDRVCHVDAAGKCWASPGPVTTGAEVTLAEVSSEDFTAWRSEATAMLHEDLRETLQAHEAKSFFYATSTDAAAGMVETLDSIAWESSTVFLYGPLK